MGVIIISIIIIITYMAVLPWSSSMDSVKERKRRGGLISIAGLTSHEHVLGRYQRY